MDFCLLKYSSDNRTICIPCRSLYLPFRKVLQAVGWLPLHSVLFTLALLTQSQKLVPHARQKGRAEQTAHRWEHREQHSMRPCFPEGCKSPFLAGCCLSVQKYIGFVAGSWRMKFHWDFFVILPSPEAGGCQAGGKEMYLPVFVVSSGFVARGDLCY